MPTSNKPVTNPEEEKTTVAVASAPLSTLSDFDEFKEDIVGMDAIDSADVKMPKIKLLQLTSKEVADKKGVPGQWLNTMTGEVYDAFSCNLLAVGKNRVMWPEKFKRGEPCECRSLDSKKAYESGTLCSECQYSKWIDNERPRCNQCYTWLGLSKDGSPFRFVVSGVGISPCKDFISRLVMANVSPFVFNITLGSVQQTNESGSFFVPTFTFDQNADGSQSLISKDTYIKFKETAKSLEEIFLAAQVTDTQIADDEQTSGGGVF